MIIAPTILKGAKYINAKKIITIELVAVV